jgi:hypothetical protein
VVLKSTELASAACRSPQPLRGSFAAASGLRSLCIDRGLRLAARGLAMVDAVEAFEAFASIAAFGLHRSRHSAAAADWSSAAVLLRH